KRVVDSVEDGSRCRGAPKPQAQGKDPHVLDARVSKHPLVVRLAHDERGRQGHGKEAKADQKVLAKGSLPGAGADLKGPEDPQKRAVEERSGKKRGDYRGGFAVRVGQPGVEGRQAHFRAIAHQEKEESGLEPWHVEGRSAFYQG